ncbi:MAG TPA: LD-carboxypeptidase, partial [Alphaproteobacteria bacterium]|nr:LD-carboxypeptidase [Alphaproteobacteria bacterium]
MKHIYLIAPSYPCPQEDLAQTKSYFESLGMQVTAPPNLLGKDLLCANRDEIRLSHLQEALNDPTVDIIWLLYGGYGLTRLMPDLLQMKKPEKEKLFIGYSDGTALHVFLNQIWGWSSLHGVSAQQMSKTRVGPQTIESTLQIMREGLHNYSSPSLHPFNEKAKTMTSLSGTVVGGNLCLVECSLGTDWQINPKGKILFLEEVYERGYRVDRMLMHLQQARIFEGVKAILMGDFVKGDEKDGTSLIPAVLKRFAEQCSIPVFHLPGYGHGE